MIVLFMQQTTRLSIGQQTPVGLTDSSDILHYCVHYFMTQSNVNNN